MEKKLMLNLECYDDSRRIYQEYVVCKLTPTGKLDKRCRIVNGYQKRKDYSTFESYQRAKTQLLGKFEKLNVKNYK